MLTKELYTWRHKFIMLAQFYRSYILLRYLLMFEPREEGRRFELFWWISHPNYCVYILVIKPMSKRNLMVQWAKASAFNARHFAVLWFDSQSYNIFFHEFYIPLIVFFFIFFKKFKKNILQVTIPNYNFVNYQSSQMFETTQYPTFFFHLLSCWDYL